MKKLNLALCLTFYLTSLVSVFAKDIRRVDISEFSGDMERFYREIAFEPVIVSGVYQESSYLNSLTLESVEQAFQDRTLFGYRRSNDAGGRIREEIPSDSFFRDFKQGAGEFYVFDHSVADTPFRGQVAVPGFLNENWLDLLDPSYGFNITLSGAGSFTPFHEDGSGEQAWMYLVHGVKEWLIYPPKCRPLLWDNLFKDFYNPRKTNLNRFEFVAHCEQYKITATARSGDLIFLPPGWLHQVLTTEPSFGFGGNIFNEYQAFDSMETALNEKSHALRHDFDVVELVQANAENVRTEYGKYQVERALELHQDWAKRVRYKSDMLLPRTAGERTTQPNGAAAIE